MARSPEERSPTEASVLAVRRHNDGLKVEEIETPSPDPGEVLVRVHAAAITRDELQWPVDRLPAIPSYELSGVVEEVGAAVTGVAAGDEVFALTPFDRAGVARPVRFAGTANGQPPGEGAMDEPQMYERVRQHGAIGPRTFRAHVPR